MEGVTQYMGGGGGGGVVSKNILYGEAPPNRGTFFQASGISKCRGFTS